MSKVIKKELLERMRQTTTKWGIYQHSNLESSDPKFGYALDDQARAFWIASNFGEKKLTKIYLDFIKKAIDEQEGNFQFFYDSEGIIVPDKKIKCSEDVLGMVGWVLLETKKELKIIDSILKKAKSWKYLRSSSYLILGLVTGKESNLETKLIKKIRNSFKVERKWQWFENELNYANALLPWALWKHGRLRQDSESLRIAQLATDFLIKTCQKDGFAMPIGCNGWFSKGGIKNNYDQQSVDVAYMICCLKEAYLATKNNNYLREIKKWWMWFWGANTRKVIMVNKKGACFDAVTNKKNKVNLNQGAESTISFLMSYWCVQSLGLDEI